MSGVVRNTRILSGEHECAGSQGHIMSVRSTGHQGGQGVASIGGNIDQLEQLFVATMHVRLLRAGIGMAIAYDGDAPRLLAMPWDTPPCQLPRRTTTKVGILNEVA